MEAQNKIVIAILPALSALLALLVLTSCTDTDPWAAARKEFELGQRLENGKGVTKDLAKALDAYTRSAEQGYALAQNRLGEMFYAGEKIPKDFTAAADWFKKAAAQANAGHPCASSAKSIERRCRNLADHIVGSPRSDRNDDERRVACRARH